LVLADFRGEQRRFRQLRKALAEKMARAREALRGRRAIRGRRIDRCAARIVRDLETAAVHVGDAVDDVLSEIDPDWQMARHVALRSARRAEVEDFLARRADAIADD